jgi:hypothetical protein
MRANFKRYVDQITQNVITLLNIWEILTRIKVIVQWKSKNRVALSNRVRCVWTLRKRCFCLHGRHPKISTTNFVVVLHHSTRVRKRTTCIFCHMCRRLPETDTSTIFNLIPTRQSDVRADKIVTCLIKLPMITWLYENTMSSNLNYRDPAQN